ncbi:anti-sigma factor [Bacteroidia bacterium]|nr:anti-sigma factor [Bacteroidia bacterium]
MNEELLICFLKRRCTPLEFKQVEEWVCADKSNAACLFEMESVWALKDEMKYSNEKEIREAWQRFQSGIIRQEKVVSLEREAKKTTIWKTFRRYAAVIAVFMLISSGVYFYKNSPHRKNHIILAETAVKQRIMLTLPDSTKVWLNAQSQLKYPSNFSRKNREVYLTGEGYFEVTSNVKKPFIVHSEALNIKVLGTKFDMRAYPEETSSVTLTEGKVEVSMNNEKERVTLTPNHQAVYSINAGLEVREVNPQEYLSWIDGELHFVNKPLSVIAKELERRFGVEIHFADPRLAKNIFTCHFQEDVSLIQILDFLKKTQRFNYEIKEKNILII